MKLGFPIFTGFVGNFFEFFPDLFGEQSLHRLFVGEFVGTLFASRHWETPSW